MMLSLNFHDIAFITIKVVDYCCIIHDISKPEAINFSKSSILDNFGYI